MHQPWRHWPGFEPDTSIISRMPYHDPLELRGIGRALTTPHPLAGLIDNADRGQLLEHVQTNKIGPSWVSHVSMAERNCSDHGTVGILTPAAAMTRCPHMQQSPDRRDACGPAIVERRHGQMPAAVIGRRGFRDRAGERDFGDPGQVAAGMRLLARED